MGRRLLNHFWLLLACLAIALTWWLENRPALPSAPPAKPTRSSAYEALRETRLVDHRDNDGDSFMIQHAGGTHTFRLHFADAPEKRMHQYNGERLQHQARYFGGLTVPQVLQVGVKARDYALDLLRSRPFTVHTRWRPVFDSGRYYAFVVFDDGEDLSEKLVNQGLARIYTEGAAHPDGRSEADFKAHLKSSESRARSNKRGAWGIR